MLQTENANLYLDMTQFASLKRDARAGSEDAAKSAAQQFEALFLQRMLKDMRAAARFDDSQHSNATDFYQEMYDKQLALMLSKQGGIGIADLLQRQLGGSGESARSGGQGLAAGTGKGLPLYPASHRPGPPVLPLDAMHYRSPNPEVRTHALDAAVEPSGSIPSADAAPASLDSETLLPFAGWDSPDHFVRDLWPHADKAAARLGVSTELLVAQAALETGWGRHAMRRPDGGIAYNLFGIKAGSDWSGASITRSTLEFRGGAMQREQARFRAYDNLSEAFDDYARFLETRSHYRAALQHGGSDERYIRGLQQGGYATDPNYADKVLGILRGQTLRQALAAIDTVKENAHV